jgi:hypothetical protein
MIYTAKGWTSQRGGGPESGGANGRVTSGVIEEAKSESRSTGGGDATYPGDVARVEVGPVILRACVRGRAV